MDHPSPRNRTPRTGPPARQASLREHNLALVARTVADATAPPSRADISAATGLTRATVSALVDRLTGAGIVAELPPATPQRAGRPAVPLTLAGRTVVGLGIEVNVDYLGARVLDLTGERIAERIVPGDFHDSHPRDVLTALGDIAGGMLDDARALGMSVAGARLALPGLVDARTGFLRVAPNLGWSDLDAAPLLGLADIAVTTSNEAKLAALAQLARRSGPGAPPADAPETPFPDSYLYVSGDVGIGSAMVTERRLFTGMHGWSGEIGHVVVDPAGPSCRCGSRGCLEQYAGKEAIWRMAGADRLIDAKGLAARFEDGDPATRDAMGRAGTALGSALADYVNLVDVDDIVLGGIYGPLFAPLRPIVEETLAHRVLSSPWKTVTLRPAPVDDHAALTGGASVVLREVVETPSAWVTDH